MKNVTLILLCIISMLFHCKMDAQELTNEEQSKANVIHDFLECDMAVYALIKDCEIIDSMGQYTVQKISILPLQILKGAQDTLSEIISVVEVSHPLFAAGDQVGFFLTRYKNELDEIQYAPIENSGFRDPHYLQQIANIPSFLAEELQRFSASEEEDFRPQWVIVKPHVNTTLSYENEVEQTIAFFIKEDVPQWRLSAGQIVSISVLKSSYSDVLNSQILPPGTAYLIPLYREVSGRFSSSIVYFLKKW